MWVRVLDETTNVVVNGFMSLDALIARDSLEYSTAEEALQRFRRYWWYNDETRVMYYLVPAFPGELAAAQQDRINWEFER
ncbi:MAG TPA: hypothetical protein VKD00_07015 [Methyloceanibacter sp.]|nr:hypothetical protein [Methyloceanibacter sp.]